jgi:hypothetical protein
MAKVAKKAKDVEESKGTGLIPRIKSTAMSKDSGPMVIRGLSEAKAIEEQANAALMQVDKKRYDLLSHLTLGIIKAAKADGSIDLAKAFGDGKDMGVLNDQLGIALGFRDVVTINAGTPQEAQRVAWSKDVAPMVTSTKEEKDTPEGKRRSTVRSNFLHSLKKCAQTACGIIENKITAKMDKQEGTLLLSGPAVKAQFGQPSVHLNEKQTVGDGDHEVKLTEKPSFVAIAAKAGEKHGKVVHRGSNTRGAQKVLSNPTEALRDIAKTFISFVKKIGKEPNDKQKEILQSVQDVLDEVLT